MAKKVAVLAVNPVNGFGLFQYLESFFENGITYKVYAVADSKEIKTNSGIALTVDDVIANLKGHEDEYDAMVFACGDAVPVFRQRQMCIRDSTGITEGKKLAVHPLAKPAISKGQATDEDSVVDGNFFTAKEEHYICTMMPQVLEALKK